MILQQSQKHTEHIEHIYLTLLRSPKHLKWDTVSICSQHMKLRSSSENMPLHEACLLCGSCDGPQTKVKKGTDLRIFCLYHSCGRSCYYHYYIPFLHILAITVVTITISIVIFHDISIIHSMNPCGVHTQKTLKIQECFGPSFPKHVIFP